jgi:(2Fe-2S) ferredoxin
LKESPKNLSDRIERIGIEKSKRHMILCGGSSCCQGSIGDEVWEYLKKRTRELGEEKIFISRSRAICLRICQQGPVAVVYPEGIWYARLDVSNCERVISEHLISGRPVDDLIIARNSLEQLR